jgi:ABC-type sugar transport system ATPase subunit
MALSPNTPRPVLEISGLTKHCGGTLALAEDFDVPANIFLGREITRLSLGPLSILSHNLRQVHDLVDRLWVFRQGRIIANLETRHTHPEQIVGLITGAIDPARLVREPVATP